MSNKIKCLVCGDIIESKHRHDFVVCSCWDGKGKGCAVDGGNDYYRRVGSNYEEVVDSKNSKQTRNKNISNENNKKRK